MSLVIFTDGSSRGNPGPGGWGSIIISDDLVKEIGGREESTTNNRMELTAVISALESVPNEHEITIYTDSAYVLNGITRWVKGWQRNNWKTSQKENVLNKDLWEKLVSLTGHKVINWKLVKGHSGNTGNERCDVIATSFADQSQQADSNPIILYNGSRERYGVSLSQSTISDMGEVNGERVVRSRSRAYSYVSLVGVEIVIHKTWEECKKRVEGIANAKYKKSVSPEDEERVIREFAD